MILSHGVITTHTILLTKINPAFRPRYKRRVSSADSTGREKRPRSLTCPNHYYTVASGATVSTLKGRAFVCFLELVYRKMFWRRQAEGKCGTWGWL